MEVAIITMEDYNFSIQFYYTQTSKITSNIVVSCNNTTFNKFYRYKTYFEIPKVKKTKLLS